jgi:hypothetical protein
MLGEIEQYDRFLKNVEQQENSFAESAEVEDEHFGRMSSYF